MLRQTKHQSSMADPSSQEQAPIQQQQGVNDETRQEEQSNSSFLSSMAMTVCAGGGGGQHAVAPPPIAAPAASTGIRSLGGVDNIRWEGSSSSGLPTRSNIWGPTGTAVATAAGTVTGTLGQQQQQRILSDNRDAASFASSSAIPPSDHHHFSFGSSLVEGEPQLWSSINNTDALATAMSSLSRLSLGCDSGLAQSVVSAGSSLMPGLVGASSGSTGGTFVSSASNVFLADSSSKRPTTSFSYQTNNSNIHDMLVPLP